MKIEFEENEVEKDKEFRKQYKEDNRCDFPFEVKTGDKFSLEFTALDGDKASTFFTDLAGKFYSYNKKDIQEEFGIEITKISFSESKEDCNYAIDRLNHIKEEIDSSIKEIKSRIQ